jgi:hypothetical protein
MGIENINPERIDRMVAKNEYIKAKKKVIEKELA